MKTISNYLAALWLVVSGTGLHAQTFTSKGISTQPPSRESAAKTQKLMDDAEFHVRAAKLALSVGNNDEAENQYLHAFRLIPHDGRTVLALAHLYQKQGKSREAFQFWHELIYPQGWGSSVSSDPRVRCEYILLLTGRPDSGGAAWREAAALYNRTLQERGQAANSAQLFVPNRPEVAKLRARAHAVLGDNYTHGPAHAGDKIAHLQEAGRTLPNDPAVQVNLGLALRKAGRFEEASKAFHKARALHPTDKSTAMEADHFARETDLQLERKKHQTSARTIEDDRQVHSRSLNR